MSLLALSGTNSAVAGGYEIENSLKLEKSNNEHLYRAMVDGNRKTWTFSCWIKRTELLQANSQVLIHFGVNHQVTRMFIDDTNDQIYLDVCSTANELYRSITNRRFRDTSAWYHIVWRMDTTQGTAANRMRLYINGVEETSWSQHQIPPQNYETLANTTAGGYDDMGIGTFVWAGSSYDGLFSGYLAQVAHIDGQSYAPTEFGEFDEDSGIWKPKDVSDLNYGTSNNSFFLDFEIAADLGANAKGNDVNWSLNNISAANQATDTPTNNFCTWNPLFSFGGNEAVINEGATTADSVSGGWKGAVGTIAATNGKWYWEYKPVAGVFGHRAVGIMGADYDTDDIDDPRDYCPNLFLRDGLSPYIYQHLISGVETGYKAMTSWSSNNSDVFAIALNLDDEEITFYRNGTAITENGTSNTTFSISSVIGQSEPILPYYRSFDSTEIYFNFGGYTEMTIASGNTDANGYGTFEYAPPSGYYALCTKNLAEYG